MTAALRVQRFFFEAVEPVRLDSFRRVLALTFLIYMAYWFTSASEWLTSAGFHYTAETERLHYPDPWPTLPDWGVPVFGVVLFGSALGAILGFKARLCTWLLLGCAVYVQRVDMISAFTLNKLYIVSFAVLALAPAPRKLPVDGGGKELLQSVWPIRILQATLIIQYFTAGLCKIIHGDWLEHTDVLWTQAQGVYRTELAGYLLQLLPVWVWAVLAYSALAFELLSPVLFLVKRLVPIAIIWGIGFHLGIALTMEKLIFFSLQLIAFYVLFIPAERLQQVRTGKLGRKRRRRR